MSYINFKLKEFTIKTKDNINKLYDLIVNKYSNTGTDFYIKYNNKTYYRYLRNTIVNISLLPIELPYPNDIVVYINTVDIFKDDLFTINRFIIKAQNELDYNFSCLLANYLDQLSDKDFAENDDFTIDQKIFLNKYLTEEYDIIDAIKRFKVDNIIL